MNKSLEDYDFDKIVSEIKDSDYNMYRHKKTKRYLIEILNKYFDDYEVFIINENWYHDRQLWMRYYYPYSPDDTVSDDDTVSIEFQLY